MSTIPKSANREYLEDEVQAEEVDFLLLQEVQDELPPFLTCCGGGKKKHQHQTHALFQCVATTYGVGAGARCGETSERRKVLREVRFCETERVCVRPATSFVAIGPEWMVACVAFLSVFGLTIRDVSKRNGSSCKAGLDAPFSRSAYWGRGKEKSAGRENGEPPAPQTMSEVCE